MTVEDAAEFFEAIPAIYRRLQAPQEVGLVIFAWVSLRLRFQAVRRNGETLPKSVQTWYRSDLVCARWADDRFGFHDLAPSS